MSAPPAPAEGRPTSKADRALRICLHVGFWVPLAICTYMALAPSPPQPVFRVSDVVLHAFAFTYLTFALGLAQERLSRPMLVVWMLLYGAGIEVVQSFEVARNSEVKDLLVDVAGILMGLALLALLGEWSRRTARRLIAAAVGGQRAKS